VHTHAGTHTHTHACTHTRIHARMHANTHTHKHTHTYIHINVCIYDLNILVDWFRANKLSLNTTKTNYILFSKHNKTIDTGIHKL